jgi:membrane protein
MHEENTNQDKQQSKIHSKLQEFKFAARSWLDDTIQELKTNPSHAVWKISSVTAFSVAVISFLYALYNLITAYMTGVVQFKLFADATSFGSMYLSGWVGMLVSLLIGIMIISVAILYVSESEGIVRILGEVLIGLIIVGYVMRFLLVGDIGIFINEDAISNSSIQVQEQVLIQTNNILLSLRYYVLSYIESQDYSTYHDIINGVFFVLYAPYIGLILLMWFSDNDIKFKLKTSLVTFLCIQVLFRFILWLLDNLSGIVRFVSILIACLVILWVLGSALSGSFGDHSIYTNDLGEEIRIDHNKKA